ncbi:hypothetical protein DU99_25410 (plasmid) [Sinorhizobium meliloti]|nr:hypothetical protein DU99_25410 [Sinorhizobium meliloti]
MGLLDMLGDHAFEAVRARGTEEIFAPASPSSEHRTAASCLAMIGCSSLRRSRSGSRRTSRR